MSSVEQTKKCPYCAEQVQLDAVVCKHCKRDIPQSDRTTKSVPEMKSDQETSEAVKSSETVLPKKRNVAAVLEQ